MTDENGGLDRPSAVEKVLTEWFLLREAGSDPDLFELCEGNVELEAHARKLLGCEPELLRRQAESSGPDQLASSGVLAPMEFADFRILRRIASGGSGTVFLAKQERLGRLVALKVIDRSQLGPPRVYQRLRREAAIAASLNHPNIVPIYAVGEEGNKCFIAMRYLAGPALNDVELPLDPRRASEICLALAEALEAAHSMGIVHRDVKPANILLEEGVPFLVDFGLARSAVDPTLTQVGTVPGTLPYIAPETLSWETPTLDPRTDVYALGITLYELLRGRPPFEGEEQIAIVHKILLQDPAPIGLPRAHRDLETIVMRALEKDPRRRMPSARAFAGDLARYLDGEPISSRPIGFVGRMVRRARRHPRILVFAIPSVVLMLAMAALTYVARLGEERALHSGLQLVEAAIDEGRVRRAKLTLDDLLVDHKRTGELARLADRIEGETATDVLFAALYQRPLFLDWAGLDQAVQDVRASKALEEIPMRARSLLSMAEWCLGREALANRELDALRAGGKFPFASAAIAVLLGHPAISEVAQGSVDEHVIKSLALLLGGRGYSAQDEQLTNALEMSPGHPRASYARGVALAAGGQFGLAEEAILGVIDPHIDTRDAKRLLVRIRIQRGKFQSARIALESIPGESWGVVEAYHDLELLFQARDFVRFEEHLDEHRSKFAAPALIDLIESQYLLVVHRDLEGATGIFEHLYNESPDPALRDLAAAHLYRLQVKRQPLPELENEVLQVLAARGEELWETLTYPRARGIVAWQQGVVLLFSKGSPGLKRLEDAMQLLPGECLLRASYAEQCMSLAQHAPGLVARGFLAEGTEHYVRARARAALGDAVRALERGDTHASEEVRVILARIILRFVETTSDWGFLAESWKLLTALPPSAGIGERLREAEARSEAALENLYGGAGE